MQLKTGRLSNKEKEQLQQWCKTMSIEEMATKLNRRPDAIEEWSRTYAPKVENLPENEKLINELHNTIYWKDLKKQFLEEELRSFEVYWVGYMNQFNSDVEFSEQVQLVDLIKMELLIARNLEERVKAKKEVEILQGKLDEFTKKYGYPPFLDESQMQDIAKMNEYTILAQGVKACEASYTSRTAELNTLSNKKDAYTEELKATRKQRIEILRNVKKDFVSLIKSLMDEKTREKEGKEVHLMNLAASKELERLSEYHIYSDGVADKPVLNHETVKEIKE